MPDRRTLVAIAGGVTLTVVAGSAALAANLGILASADSDVGDLSPVSVPVSDASTTTTAEPPTVETIVVDEYVEVPSSSGAAVPPATSDTSFDSVPPATIDNPGTAPITTPETGHTEDGSDEGHVDDEEPEQEDHSKEHDEHEEEYEGAEDDD